MKRTQWIVLASLLVTVVVGGVVSIVLYNATFAAPQTRIQAIMAYALDEQFNPVQPTGEFAPDDVFYLSVRVENATANGIVTARWYYTDSLIHMQDQVTREGSETYLLGFELQRTDGDWPVGDYRVEILLDGEAIGTAYFFVVDVP